MGNILNVNNINVYYGAIHAIKGISFKVEEGEIVTLIGANGAGKSTTLNTISGLLRSKTGDISFMGSSISKMSPNKIVQSGLVMVPEGRRIFLGLTVEENLEMGAYTRPKAEIKSSLEEVYELFPRLKDLICRVPDAAAHANGAVIPQIPAYFSDDHGNEYRMERRV